jgi:homoserine O-acetyltransferase
MNYFTYEHPFPLESGASLPGITLAYHTYGRLNDDGSNVVWVCHALTANSDVAHWWPGVVGEKGPIHPDDYFIVCANILGSCYGSTGPLSVDPAKAALPGAAPRLVDPLYRYPGEGVPYYADFPQITIRDMVNAHILLRKHLGIGKIHLLMGGSMGGYQALEWSVMERAVIGQLFLIATSPAESAWGIAVHTAQRLAIEADSSFRDNDPHAGSRGLKAARAVGILTYRNYGIMVQKQTDPDTEKLDGYKASSYIEYQGDKLVSRFNAACYWLLTKAMDSHQLSRGRGGDLETVLRSITQRTLVMGITSDILCPVQEQRHMVEHLPDATLVEIDSAYGHDGFMVEGNKIASHLRDWLAAAGAAR